MIKSAHSKLYKEKDFRNFIEDCFRSRSFGDIVVSDNPSEGSWNQSFIVATNSGKFFVKTNSENGLRLKSEFVALKYVFPTLSSFVPEPIFFDGRYNILALDYKKDLKTMMKVIPMGDLTYSFKTISKILALLHCKVKNEKPSGIGHKFLKLQLSQMKPFLSKSLFRHCESVVGFLTNKTSEICLIHRDLDPVNTCEKHLLDWEYSGMGYPTEDVGKFIARHSVFLLDNKFSVNAKKYLFNNLVGFMNDYQKNLENLDSSFSIDSNFVLLTLRVIAFNIARLLSMFSDFSVGNTPKCLYRYSLCNPRKEKLLEVMEEIFGSKIATIEDYLENLID